MTEPDQLALIAAAAAFDSRTLPAGSLLLTRRGTTWAQTACVPYAVEDEDLTASRVTDSATRLIRAAAARVQPGLDMWQPRGRSRAAAGIVEYVTSVPESRTDYYHSQYTASGPAMRELWERGWVQRFVGFEIQRDLIPTEYSEWDVLHVTALALRALPRMMFWTRRFDEHARRAGYGSMRALQEQWAQQRSKVQRRTRIRDIDPS